MRGHFIHEVVVRGAFPTGRLFRLQAAYDPLAKDIDEFERPTLLVAQEMPAGEVNVQPAKSLAESLRRPEK